MESYMVSATSVVYGTDAHCYDRTDCSSQSGSGKSQTDRKHEYIIKYNVKGTSTAVSYTHLIPIYLYNVHNTDLFHLQWQ